jgi:hypothetical protein
MVNVPVPGSWPLKLTLETPKTPCNANTRCRWSISTASLPPPPALAACELMKCEPVRYA